MSADFETALASFFAGVQKIHADYMDKNYPTNDREPWRLDRGKRYVRVVHGGSVYCFVDTTNGAVLKAAGWKGPAKHARGNVLDDKNGLGWMGPYGPAHVR
ncbi:MAG: hypothetical protein HXX10_07620 [Rhodoplanes sp.]|uniref:DUF7717 family protein n=1 Tax=Rhodoplanes sp. TaxID=1968906 RepID=UPI001853443A|nr:hypothetical protein [Rhodoplanes sp.]NVO13889.1 hypothetical protein [Rhodoplanes sp.]